MIPALAGLAGAVALASVGAAGSAEAIAAGGNAWHVACADTNGDGRSELVTACFDGSIRCLNLDERRCLWTYDTRAFPYDLEVADLDGDDRAESLVASADGNLYVIGHDGLLRWKFATPAPLYQVATMRAGDATRVIAAGVDRNLYVLSVKGELLERRSRRNVVRLLGVGDLDGDRRDDLVIADWRGGVEALGGPGLRTLWRDSMRPRGGVHRQKIFRPYFLTIEDLDGDGRCELLFGSSFYNSYGVRVLSGSGSVLWEQQEGFDFRDGSQGSHTAPIACDVSPTPGKEVVVLNARRLFVFDARGKLLDQAAAPIGFTNIRAGANDNRDPSVFLASSPNGDDRIYRVRFGENWERAFSRLDRDGKMAVVGQNIEQVRRQVLAYRGAAPRGAEYVNLIAAGQPDSPERLQNLIQTVSFYRKQFPYRSCLFALSLTIGSNEPIPGFTRERSSVARRRMPPGEIPRLLQRLERAGVPFVFAVGHSCEPSISLETAESILRACPTTCLGFSSSENMDRDGSLEHYLNEYWFPLMDLCKKSRKKAFMVEKAAWWATVPAMKRYRKLADGSYADVLVMSVEDSNSRSPELNLAGRAGLFLSGAVNQLSARTIPDELCWNRIWEWECALTGHPFLRRQVVQALLGARFFEYKLVQTTAGEQMGFTQIGSESVEILLHMLGKGLLVPPAARDMAGISPLAIKMREPSADFLVQAENLGYQDAFTEDRLERTAPMSGLACYWGAAPTEESYIGGYLLDQETHFGNFIPKTPYGFPAIVPTACRSKIAGWPVGGWETDGRWFYDDGSRVTGLEARSRVLADFKAAADGMPFQLLGPAFMQAQRMGDDVFRLTLIDPGYLDPDDRQVVIRVRDDRPVKQVVDLLSGQALETNEGQIGLTIPAGVFRIVEVKF